MLKIYGNKGSGSANKVEYTLHLLNMPHDYKDMDFQKDLKTPEYLKIHPAGKIPAIDDDGFILFESNAICRYLCDKKGNSLYPKDLKKRALVDQWTDFTNLHVATAMGKIAVYKVFAKMMGMIPDENSYQEGLKLMGRFMPIIDAQLANSTYLAGQELTLADINLFAALEYADKSAYDLSEWKHVSNWRKKLMAMDFYKKSHA